MGKHGSSRTNDLPSYSQPWYRMVFNHGIHILLVDHDKECLNSTANLLELCAYKVTKVNHASTALNMLRAQKKQFEVVIANIHSPDLHENHLFQEAVKLDLLVILMSSDEETLLANRAIENGAFMFVHKPINIELVKHLWQHVLRDRRRKNKEKDAVGEKKVAEENNGGGENDANTKVSGKRKVRSGKAPMEDQISQEADDNCYKAQKKVCTVQWTAELHAKFMDAVNQLGEGRCYPREILERMNVHGLSRMQVASHLQKCRHDNWKPRGERRNKRCPSPEYPKNDNSQENNNVRRFGSMPRSCKASQPEQKSPGTPRRNLASGNNNISANERGESSKQDEVSQITGQYGSMKMLNGDASYFVCPVDKSHGNEKGILISTGVPATTNALYMTFPEFFGPNLLAFGSTSPTLITPYGNLPNQRRPSEDFLELAEEMDFLVNDPPELEQGKGSNDGQSQTMACIDQVDPEKLLKGINDGAGCEGGSKTTKFAVHQEMLHKESAL